MRILRQLAAVLLLRSAGAVLSHTAIAICMAMLWIDPMVFGPDTAGSLEFLLILEFVILHSTAFFVAFRFIEGFPRWVFILIYAPFGLVIASQVGSIVVTIAFLWHLAAGVWGDFDTAKRAVWGFVARYVPTFLWYLVLPFLVVLLGLPALGWEAYPYLAFETDQGDSWLALTPAWATLYFTGRAVWEVVVRRWERAGRLARFSARVMAT